MISREDAEKYQKMCHLESIPLEVIMKYTNKHGNLWKGLGYYDLLEKMEQDQEKKETKARIAQLEGKHTSEAEKARLWLLDRAASLPGGMDGLRALEDEELINVSKSGKICFYKISNRSLGALLSEWGFSDWKEAIERMLIEDEPVKYLALKGGPQNGGDPKKMYRYHDVLKYISHSDRY